MGNLGCNLLDMVQFQCIKMSNEKGPNLSTMSKNLVPTYTLWEGLATENSDKTPCLLVFHYFVGWWVCKIDEL